MRYAASIAVAVLLLQATGCSTPEQRYRVLSTLFDGVPQPGPPPAPTVLEAPMRAQPGVAPILAKLGFSVHGPFALKACGQCHETRQSNQLVLKSNVLCQRCHDPADFPGEVVHAPVASGQCVACHNPHRSPNRHLLVKLGSALCEQCHDQSTFAGLEKHKADRGEHCLGCHDPHAAGAEYMISRPAGAS